MSKIDKALDVRSVIKVV